VRLRGGNSHTTRGASSFLTQVFNRVRRAGASGPAVLRADSGFYNHKVTDACRKADVAFSITAKMSTGMHNAILEIPEENWEEIPYFIEGGADVAETTYRPFGQRREVRLIVRRVRPTPAASSPSLPSTTTTLCHRQGRHDPLPRGRPPTPCRRRGRDP